MATVSSPTVILQAVPFHRVHVHDRFWSPRQKVNRDVTVGHLFSQLSEVGCIENFERAARGEKGDFKGYRFADSDLYKTIEGACYVLATNPDPELDARLDEVIAVIAAAQMPDGYINTYYQLGDYERRFKNLRDDHEMYCGGHLFEAAVAHFEATGKRTLLDVATKFADLLDQTFGRSEGIQGYPGHPEPELALIKLARVTGERSYHRLAVDFVRRRGSHYFESENLPPMADFDEKYWMDDVPITDHTEIKGHAVRAAYLLSAIADIVREEPDKPLEDMLDRLWANATEKRIFLTGGIGPSHGNEGFTEDYDLPNETAYQETCASISMAMWGLRMGLLKRDAKYHDAVETALYNAVLAGVGLDGKSFFYVNPLASDGSHHREPWYKCACCPPNVLRTVAAIGGYAYAESDTDLYVNLYLPGTADLKVGGAVVKLALEGDYPWDGNLKLTFKTSSTVSFTLHLRKPGWCANVHVEVNGQEQDAHPRNGYLVIDREWRAGDTVGLGLAMPVQRIEANPLVRANVGRLAVRRGPLVYCAEGLDQEVSLGDLRLPLEAKLEATWQSILGGCVVIDGEARVANANWEQILYRPASEPAPTSIRLIPYPLWDNRSASAMEVWLRT